MAEKIKDIKDAYASNFICTFPNLINTTGKGNRLDVATNLLNETNINEVSMTESLLTPGLQTSVVIQSRVNSDLYKNLDLFYNQPISIEARRDILETFELKSIMRTQQIVYRLSDRRRINYDLEQFTLHACDQTLIKDAQTYVKAEWKCTTPSDIVSDILNNCISPLSVNIEPSSPGRDFTAENSHPFQAIRKLAEMASATTGPNAKQDPSFLHFMTYQDNIGNDVPTHHFRSLTALALQDKTMKFVYNDKFSSATNYYSPFDIMDYRFPCDFDMISDLLNGFDTDGNFTSAMNVVQPIISGLSVFNITSLGGCGTTPFTAMTNSPEDQDGCSLANETWLLKRKSKVALIDQDKIALRLTVPFNPELNVGRVIDVNFNYKPDAGRSAYGSGEYLIVNMTHNIKVGGLGVTVMDCVAKTVAAGKV